MDKRKDITILARWRVEFKADWDSVKYGNAFLETWNSYQNTASGLYATEADEWLHFCPPSTVFIFNPKVMRKHLDNLPDNAVGYWWKERVGDNNSNGWAVSIENLRLLPFVEERKTDFVLQRPIAEQEATRKRLNLPNVL